MTGSLFDKQSCTCKSECWYDPWVLSSTCCSVALSPLRDHDADALKLKIMKLKGQYQPMIGWRWEAISEEDAEKLESNLLLVDPNPESRLSAENILKHSWFSNDVATVTQARLVIGLEKSEGDDSGKGSSVRGKEAIDNGKRKGGEF